MKYSLFVAFCAATAILNLVSCEPALIKDFPHLENALAKVSEDSAFTLEEVNSRPWDTVYIVKSPKNIEKMRDIAMDKSIREYIAKSCDPAKNNILLFVFNGQLMNFCSVQNTTADFSTLKESFVTRDCVLYMGTHRKVDTHQLSIIK